MKATKGASSFATRRPVAVLVIFIAAIVLGYFSYSRLALRLMPEMSYPTITVRTQYPGAGPQEVETDISRPVEEALGVITGLRRTSSVSRAGLSDVVLEFTWKTSMSDAVQDTLESLDLVTLPEAAANSLILRFDPSLDPVMEVSLSSDQAVPPEAADAELRRIRRIAERQVKRLLEPIDGVAAARVRGGLQEEIHVLLNAGSLRSAGISLSWVASRLAEQNINVAGGIIKNGGADYLVRTLGEFQTVDEIRNTIIKTTDGRNIRLRDLGTVLYTHQDRTILTRTLAKNQRGESVQIDIYKEADANIVALADRVRQVIGSQHRESSGAATLAAQIYQDENLQLKIVGDRSQFIRSSIQEVRNTALTGGLFAVLVLFLFLKNVKSTLIIGVSIPISLFITFAPMNLFGVSLNIMSLGGLALGVGMLVDSSIVVLEAIYRKHEEGMPILEATDLGTQEVRGAVIASTLTTVGVFLPMVFVDGVAGQAFGDLGIAVVISLLVSLLVALTLLPMLVSRAALKDTAALTTSGRDPTSISLWPAMTCWRQFYSDLCVLPKLLRPLLFPLLVLRLLLSGTFALAAWAISVLCFFVPLWLLMRALVPLRRLSSLLWKAPLWVTDKTLSSLRKYYPRFLRWSLGHGTSLMTLMLLCMGLTFFLARNLETELLPEVHQSEFSFELSLAVGTTVSETARALQPIESTLLSDIPSIESIGATYGYDPATSRRSEEGEHTAQYRIHLRSGDAGGRGHRQQEEEVSAAVREKLATVPDLRARLLRPVLFSFQTPIEVEIYGTDLEELQRISDLTKIEMQKIGSITDVESSLAKGAPEVQIVYRRQRMRQFDLDIAEVAKHIRDAIKGREATRFTRGDRKMPVIVRLKQEDRASVADLRRLIVDPEKTGSIALSSIAEVTLGAGPSEVRRVDGRRVAIVRANLQDGVSLSAAVSSVRERLAQSINWPEGMHFSIAGQSEEWKRSQQSLWLALALSIFLVFVIMAAQFESLIYPLIIMASIPLAFLGTVATLSTLGIHLSIMVFLGMIMLAGIVVNNAIVLVDYVNRLKKRGMSVEEAVVQAGEARLRPILMTTMTTALGLLPMALGYGDGAELRTPLAITVISGLLTSTVLTLVLIPTLYVQVDRGRQRLRVQLGKISPGL